MEITHKMKNMKIAVCDDIMPAPDTGQRDANEVLKGILLGKGHTVFSFNGRDTADVAMYDNAVCAEALARIIETKHCNGMIMDLHWWGSDDPERDVGVRLLEKLQSD